MTPSGMLYEWTDGHGVRWREVSTERGETFCDGDEGYVHGETRAGSGWSPVSKDVIGQPTGDFWYQLFRRRVAGPHGETAIPPGLEYR